MKTTSELEKMTKSDLIDYITDTRHREVVEMPSLARGMTLGTMVIFDKLVQYLCNVRASAGNAWTYLSRLMDVMADVEGNITITLKGGSHSISVCDLLNQQELEYQASLDDMIDNLPNTPPCAVQNCSGRLHPSECVGCRYNLR
jgi:hypothetical protein